MPMPRKKRRLCLSCQAECKRAQDKYCSNKCQQEYAWSQKRQRFELTGKFDGVNNQTSLSKHHKRYLLEVGSHCCKICKTKTWMDQKVPLVLDHIDGNADNWDLENLRLICHNCDAQTSTFAGRNRGNGRAYRRKIYQRLGYC